MPNPLGIPLRKRNKSSPMCDTWGIGCQGFLLWSRPSLPGCKLVQNPQQQLSSQKGLFSVQAIHRESAGQIESFLRENSASVGPLVHAMHGNAGPSIVMVIDPQQRVRAPMTRQQRRVDVQRGSPGGLEDVDSSLLPRHRGANPLLWVYYHNDRRTGVTVHGMNERADAGAIFAQEAFDLPRGFPVDRLYAKKALLGGELLLRVLDQLASGEARSRPQEETLATYAPRVAHGTRLVPFSEWDAERVWHFLRGLCPRRLEPLCDRSERQVRYRSVLGYTTHDCDKAAGLIESTSFGWNLYCRDGSVQLGKSRRPDR